MSLREKEHSKEKELTREPIVEIPADDISSMAFVEYLCSLNVDENIKEEFRRLSVMFSNLCSFSYIKRYERLEYTLMTKIILIHLRNGDVQTALERMTEMLNRLTISRSIDAMGLLSMTTSTSSKSIEDIVMEERRVESRGLLGRIKGALGG